MKKASVYIFFLLLTLSCSHHSRFQKSGLIFVKNVEVKRVSIIAVGPDSLQVPMYLVELKKPIKIKKERMAFFVADAERVPLLSKLVFKAYPESPQIISSATLIKVEEINGAKYFEALKVRIE